MQIFLESELNAEPRRYTFAFVSLSRTKNVFETNICRQFRQLNFGCQTVNTYAKSENESTTSNWSEIFFRYFSQTEPNNWMKKMEYSTEFIDVEIKYDFINNLGESNESAVSINCWNEKKERKLES